MRVVDPYEITLSYSNVDEDSNPEWSAVTTYGQDDEVKVTTGQRVHKVYRSLRGNNLNRYPPDWLDPQPETATSSTSIAVGTGNKTFTIQAGKGYSLGMVVKIARTITPNTVNMIGEITDYNVGTGSMTVSVYQVTGSGTLTGWTITSEDEIGFWEEIGATNQHKVIDEYVNTQTKNLGLIQMRFPVERVDFLTLFGLDANTVTVTLWDSDMTEGVWSEEFDLTYTGAGIVNIVDWFEYFFGEFTKRTDLLIPIGAILFQGVLDVKIEGNGDVYCGNMICGRLFELGKTQFGMDLGMLDFSKYETDDQGRTKVVPGYWSKRMEATIYMPNSYVDSVHKRLSKLVGVPTAWIGDSGYESSIVYGTFRDFSVTVEGPSHSFCRLEVEGII